MVRLSIFYFLPYSGSIRLSAKTVTITVAMQHAITIQKKLVLADSFLNVTGKHARNHHAQRHECGADSIV